MSRVKLARNTFNSGELDPLLSARFDVRAHQQGASELKNVVCLPQGGVQRRDGLQHLGAVSLEDDARLIPFAFNTEQTYLLVFGTNVMYVYKNGVRVSNINGSGLDYLATPWTLAEILLAGWTQSADTLIVASKDHATRSITRGATDADWTLATINFVVQPTEDFNADYDAGTFTLDATTGTGITLTCAGATPFTAEHVGGRFEGPEGIAEITAFTSATSVTVDILQDFASTTVKGSRAFLSEPVWTAEHGYPSVVTFHQGRLWLAATTSQPQSLWGSKSNQFFNFDYGTGLDDEAIGVTLDTDQVNAILHLVSIRNLQIFTTGGEFYLPDSPVTPEKSSVQRQSRFGASRVRPAVIDGSTLFVQRTGKVIREYLFQFVEDAYTANSASLLASHLINNPQDMSAFRGSQNRDANYVYVVNSDGTVAVYNSLREQEIAAWSHWESELTFKRVAVVDSQVYFLVEYDGTIYLTQLREGLYTDLAYYNESLGSDTVSSMTWFPNGTVVNVRADGSTLGQETVSNGEVIMDRSGDEVEIGLPFTVAVTTLPLNVDMQEGTKFADLKRIFSVHIDLYESLGVFVNTIRLADRRFGEPTDGPPIPYTGLKRVRILGWDRQKKITISQSDPQPFYLRALILEVET